MIDCKNNAACCLLLALIGMPLSLSAQVSSYRINAMQLRDPHVFVNLFSCVDVTDTALLGFSVNGALQTQIQTDDDGDGFLGLSTIVEFLPLDQSQNVNLMDSGNAQCTTPMATTSCGPITNSAIAGDAVLLTAGTCMTPVTGTTRPYSTPVVDSSAPCFSSPLGTLSLDIGGIPVPLQNAQMAASFVGTPATSLSNGLLRGFITEESAHATLLPSDLPLIGGHPLSSILPGGDPPGTSVNCASFSDVDLLNGVRGWWFYFNFTAAKVAASDDAFANGFGDGFE